MASHKNCEAGQFNQPETAPRLGRDTPRRMSLTILFQAEATSRLDLDHSPSRKSDESAHDHRVSDVCWQAVRHQELLWSIPVHPFRQEPLRNSG